MQGHQKSFAIVDKKHHLMPYFITISNIESHDVQRVITGNQRVMHARLSDAEFFYKADIKRDLSHYIARLKTVVFQTQLGTLYDKTNRVRELAAVISGNDPKQLALTQRAAELCKADLMTDMVGEFPELQGIAGYYYAQHAKEPMEVALAIKEHYLPRFAGDELPTTPAGCAVAIADRLDTLVGIFGINQIPTGEKDPFGLRRAAIGILRIIIEHELNLDLRTLIDAAYANYTSLPNTKTPEQVFDFIMERLRAWYADRHISAEVFNAVLAVNPSQPLDFHHRINAVSQFIQLPEAAALAAANKRVSRILQKENIIDNHAVAINPALFENDAERLLADALTKQESTIKNSQDYTNILNSLASLRQPVDQFFDHVMVMTEDKARRDNRLALLQQLRASFLKVADISVLQG